MEPVAAPPVKVETADSPPAPKAVPDDGFRTGNLLVLPKDTEYRATNPALPKTTPGAGAVIITPPSPPKPKPPPQE